VTKPGHSAPIIPIAEVDRATCEHELAGPREFRCPACKGILRRCCLTALGWNHMADCPAVPAQTIPTIEKHNFQA